MSLQNISGARHTRCDTEVYSLKGERETPPQKFLKVLTRAWPNVRSTSRKHHRRIAQFGVKLRELSFPKKPMCKPFSRSPSSPLQCVEDTAVLPDLGFGGCFKQTGFSGWIHPVQGPWLNPNIGWRKEKSAWWTRSGSLMLWVWFSSCIDYHFLEKEPSWWLVWLYSTYFVYVRMWRSEDNL